MAWTHIAYLLGLIFVATKLEDSNRRNSFRKAWVTFALIPFWFFIMQLLRAGHLDDDRALRLVEIWDAAIASVLWGISLLFLVGAIAPKEVTLRVASPKNQPPKPNAMLKPKAEQATP